MLIRSQDKKSLINLSNIACITLGKTPDGYGMYAPSEGYSNKIGEYSSESRVIKVQDMIQAEYQKYMTLTKGNGPEALFNYPKVFQMPKESEVPE